jgi:hypothetical protein
LLSLCILAACGETTSSTPGSSAVSNNASAFDPISREGVEACVREWNAPANAESRTFVVSRGYGEAHVSVWAVDHPAEGTSGYGCSYLFEDDKRYETFDGTWMGSEPGVDLRWNGPPTRQGGRWSKAQEDAVGEPDADLADDGMLTLR